LSFSGAPSRALFCEGWVRNKGLKITLTDEGNEKNAEFRFTGGIAEFVNVCACGATADATRLHSEMH
jgi:hypothetical protein